MSKKKYEKPCVDVVGCMLDQNILSACNTTAIQVYCKIGSRSVYVFGDDVSGCGEESDTFYYKYYDGKYYVIWYTTNDDNTDGSPNSTEQSNLLTIMRALGLTTATSVSGILGWHYAEYSTSLYGMS